jgi:hypothetical protein
VEGDSVDVILAGGVCRKQGVCPLFDVVLVVVEPKNLDTGMVAVEDRAQVLSHKVPRLLGGVDAALPACGVLRLVLDRYAPNVDSL